MSDCEIKQLEMPEEYWECSKHGVVWWPEDGESTVICPKGLLNKIQGKGRWCPRCEAWLKGLQVDGDACGTCHTYVEWKPLDGHELNFMKDAVEAVRHWFEVRSEEYPDTLEGRLAHTKRMEEADQNMKRALGVDWC